MAVHKSSGNLPLNIILKKRIELIAKRKWLILSFFLGFFAISIVISNLLPKIYSATSKVVFNYNSIFSGYLSNSGSIDTELEYLKSKSFIQSVFEGLKSKGIQANYDELNQNVEYYVENSNTVLNLSVENNDPEKSAAIANAFASSLKQQSLFKNKLLYILYLKSLVDKEKSVRDGFQLGSIDELALSRSSQITSAEERIITRIAEFESELEKLEIDNQYYLSERQLFENEIKKVYPLDIESPIVINDPKFLSLKSKLERFEAIINLKALTGSLSQFSINFPWVESNNLLDTAKTKSDFDNLLLEKIEEKDNKDEFISNLVKYYFSYDIKINAVELMKSVIFIQITDLENSFNRIPFEKIESSRQLRTIKFHKKLSLKIKSKIQRLKSKENEYLASIESIRQSKVPETFISPNITLNVILGSLVGVIIGLLMAMFTKKEDIDLINSVDDIEELGYSLISQIPSFKNGNEVLFDSHKDDGKNKRNSKLIDAFASIGTFLKYGSLDKSLRTVLVASGNDGEGKSIIAANIAIALANDDNKVLLIDADLKHPQLNKFFKLKSSPSLAHFLFRKKELDEIIRSTYKENLKLITCIEFPQNPSAIITSERMKDFVAKAKENFDYIIYDSSSFCSLKETAEIARLMDEIILVIMSGKTKQSELVQTESILNEYGVTKFNVILNNAKI